MPRPTILKIVCMSQKLQPVRGTHDLLPEAAAAHRDVADRARAIGALAGFEEIAPPIFEFSEVFHRTLGETSDVVSKETYTFEDRGGESLTLRPELTASICRAFISNGLQEKLPCKFFYHGPAFRYERPQKGRQRQFHQIGMEWLGTASYHADVEMIALGQAVLEALGLEKHITLTLNSLGDSESRAAHREALVAYFTQYKNDLSDDSKIRLEKNPLRILDSKDEGDRKLIAGAPSLAAHFNAESAHFFEQVQEGLASLGISAEIDTNLVRGLDYYSHTVWEFVTDALGAQGTVLAGGRYDSLIGMMGGPETPAIGWAAGVERLVALREELGQKPPAHTAPRVAVIPMDDAADRLGFAALKTLREGGIHAEPILGGAMGKRFKKADKMGATHVVVIGEEEVQAATVSLRNMKDGSQQSLTLDALVGAL